ncbi:MAG TPA: PH domain-containing protein [Patescibacteria group bacterium]|nr:PH domain-containing protein [Patescibacteria group bacterium]
MTDRDVRFAQETEQQSPADEKDSTRQPLPKEKILTRMHNKLGRLHLFAAFCEKPSNVTFQTQEPDEQVLVFLRKSQWINFPWIVATLLLLFVPIVLYLLRDNFIALIPPLRVILVLIPFYYLLVAIYAFVNFITWYYNAAIITNKRVVDIDFHQIVFKDVAETKLALVQDVSYNQVGVLPNILGYGFVLIQTAGTLDNFEFHNLPHPDRVEEVVEDLIGGRRMYEP